MSEEEKEGVDVNISNKDASSSKKEEQISKPKRGRPPKKDINSLTSNLGDKLKLDDAIKNMNNIDIDTNRKTSIGERKLYELLTGLKITYSKEQSFDNLRGDRTVLRFDVMVIIKGRIGFIEIDGRQHREFVPDFHKTQEAFEKQKEYDLKKNIFAKSTQCSLLRISDLEDKNIPFFVMDFLKKMENDNTKPHYVFSNTEIYKDPFGELNKGQKSVNGYTSYCNIL